MPEIQDPVLAIAQSASSGDEVTVEVCYHAIFTRLERNLAALGMVFEERISIVGEDIGVTADRELLTFPPQTIPVSEGDGSISVRRHRTMRVDRRRLREDSWMSSDELDARISIVVLGLTTTVVTAVTPQVSLAVPLG